MTGSLNRLIFLATIIFLIPGCSKKEVNCSPSDISAEIQMRKTSEGCRDIDILWDISFGVDLEFEIDIACGGNCSGQLIFYHKRMFLKNQDGVIDLSPSSIATRAFYECNKVTFPSYTLNTRADDPGPGIYAVGDTVLFEFFDPRMCLTSDITDCGSNNVPLELPDFSFEYILAPEDFDCD